MDKSAQDIAASFTKAVSFPEVVMKLDAMLNDGVSNTRDFAELISHDPGLTATLLRFANSPMYGFSGTVATIDRAVSLVGMREIRDLVLSVSVKKTFDNVPNEIMTMSDYWRHSLCCALVGRRIAEVTQSNKRDVLFTAGLLHDIGQLAMFIQVPDECTKVLLKSQYHDDEVEMFSLERDIIGFDHQETGYEIARTWLFPDVLQNTIRYHHTPDEATQHEFETAVVHVGNTMAVLIELETDDFSQVPPVSALALATVNLGENQLLALLPEIEALFQEMRPIFGIAA